MSIERKTLDDLKDEHNPSSLESLQNLAMEFDEEQDCSRFLSKLKQKISSEA